jgi:hypothetical protein
MKLFYIKHRKVYSQLQGGILVKKLLSVSALILLLLVGCQETKNGTLDTSKLKEIEMNDVTEEQKKKIPITYEAATLKDGLDALPFEIKLPEKLPNNLKPFQPPVINDMTHEGKNLMVEFKTFKKTNTGKPLGVMVSVDNGENAYDTTNSEEVKLNKDISAYYLNKTLSFNQDGISYVILYMNDEISKEQHKEELIDIANQMIK